MIFQSYPLNISRTEFAEHQCTNKWFGPLFNYLMTNDTSVLANLSTKDKLWVISTAKYCQIIDGLLVYADKLMVNPERFRILVPNDPQLQRHFLQAYHDSPMGTHCGRDATYHALSRDFHSYNLSKHFQNWIRRCPHCIPFQSTQPMQIRMYKYPFYTLCVDYVGPLPASPTGNKWILTAVRPFSNYLRATPVKTAAARALFQGILSFGFPIVLQSD